MLQFNYFFFEINGPKSLRLLSMELQTFQTRGLGGPITQLRRRDKLTNEIMFLTSRTGMRFIGAAPISPIALKDQLNGTHRTTLRLVIVHNVQDLGPVGRGATFNGAVPLSVTRSHFTILILSSPDRDSAAEDLAVRDF